MKAQKARQGDRLPAGHLLHPASVGVIGEAAQGRPYANTLFI